MDVRIVTDSASDIRPALADDLGIIRVPLTIRFGDDEYTDGVDLSPEDFYEKLAASVDLPETAAPPPGAFEEAFTTHFDAGADAVICVNLSSELSATMQSATTATKSFEGKDVRVFDSRSITGGEATMALEAAKAARAGKSADEIIELLEDLRRRTRVYGALDTLDHLKKGGRIGGAQAFLGSVLSIKPCIDISTGVVEEAGKPRTRRKSMLWLRDRLREDSPVEHLWVMHAGATDFEDLLETLRPDVGQDEIHTDLIGPVIGTHGGPGTLGVCYVVKN